MRILGAAAVVVVALGLAPPAGSLAWAAEPAGDPVAEGIKLRKAGRDQEALALFQRALKENPTARTAAQLGLCEHALGLWVDAETHLQQALRDTKDPWIAKNAGALRADLASVQGKLGTVEVWGSPPGATVSVDGHVAGTLPLSAPLRVVQGRRAITVEAPGYRPQSLTIEVVPGGATRDHVALAPLALQVVPPATSTTAGHAAGIEGTPRPADVAAAPGGSGAGQPSPIYRRWWFWTIVAGVAVAGGVTAVLLTRDGNPCAEKDGFTCFTW